MSTAIAQRERLFVRAPTGLGKTMAVLYPALRALGEPDLGVDRVFYLTPRGTAAAAVRDAVERLRGSGLRLKTILLAARERTCPGGACDPGLCRYARGHHDRILGALEGVLARDTIDAAGLCEVAEDHSVCAHVLGREAAEWCDLIVGDYNYVFDPGVALRRFQDPTGPFAGRQIYLVDEAHQLPERAREMLGATLSVARLESLALGVDAGRPAFARTLRALARGLAEAAESCDAMRTPTTEAVGWSPTPPAPLLAPMGAAVTEAGAWLEDWRGAAAPPEALTGVLELLRFQEVLDRYDDHYATLMRASETGLVLELTCLDPSPWIRECLSHASAAVFYSATLTPPEHYARLLGGGRAWALAARLPRSATAPRGRGPSPQAGEAIATLTLRSPFPRENLLVVVDDTLSNRYRERPASAPRVARLIARVAACRTGPYLAFLPSYAYLGQVARAFDRLKSGITSVAQTQAMSEPDRAAFLSDLRHGGTVVGFVVMGGLFAEAVDLPGDQLVGAIIAGTGLPPPTPLCELIRAYHEERDGDGFDRAYLYPGLSRVLQAAGRVIRGPADRGVVVLADSRFAHEPYREHLPPEWDVVVADGGRSVVAEVERFWRGFTPSGA